MASQRFTNTDTPANPGSGSGAGAGVYNLLKILDFGSEAGTTKKENFRLSTTLSNVHGQKYFHGHVIP